MVVLLQFVCSISMVSKHNIQQQFVHKYSRIIIHKIYQCHSGHFISIIVGYAFEY